MPPLGTGAPTPFDGQAREFDRRVGLPEADCRAIAAAVLALAGAGAGDRVLEIGAGTGMIGRWFLDHLVGYVGLDLSRGMLEVFRRRQGAARAGLVQANAARPWPLPAGSARVVFSSRAIHLLPLAHVVDELFRVGVRPPRARGAGSGSEAHGARIGAGTGGHGADAGDGSEIAGGGAADLSGGTAADLIGGTAADLIGGTAADLIGGTAALVLGWVERPEASVKARMSRQMQRLVRARGFSPRTAGGRRLLAACRERGAAELPRTAVASWPARYTPRQAVASWRSKPGLGGVVLPPGVQEAVLDELERWAARTFGGLDVESAAEETYVLEGVRLPPAGG